MICVEIFLYDWWFWYGLRFYLWNIPILSITFIFYQSFIKSWFRFFLHFLKQVNLVPFVFDFSTWRFFCLFRFLTVISWIKQFSTVVIFYFGFIIINWAHWTCLRYNYFRLNLKILYWTNIKYYWFDIFIIVYFLQVFFGIDGI